PVPNSNYQVRLQLRGLLIAVTGDQIAGLKSAISLPPGYRQALTLTLAERLCPSFEKQPHPLLIQSASKARQAIFQNNSESPRINTQDFGMPVCGSVGKKEGDFNWLSGSPLIG